MDKQVLFCTRKGAELPQLAKKIAELQGPDLSIRAVFSTGTPRTVRKRYKTDGESIRVEEAMRPLHKEGGNVLGVLCEICLLERRRNIRIVPFERRDSEQVDPATGT